MKKLFLAILFVSVTFSAAANHLKGGFFTYEYLGPGVNDNTKLRYRVTLTVYMHCQPTAGQQDASIPFSFYNQTNGTLTANINVPLTQSYDLLRSDNPCITNETVGCIYHIRIYTLESVELPVSQKGYVVSFQRCCRISGIQNLVAPSNQYGTTYSTTIPGTDMTSDGYDNSSAKFLVNDTAIICAGSYFELPVIASDDDTTDDLEFSFCDAWVGGGNGTTANPSPAAPPPYNSVPYAAGFSGGRPLGSNVGIDPKTGMISGIAPAGEGEYVITVCVTEFRNGVPIATTRKELHIYVGSCNAADASLPEAFTECESYTYTFSNQVPPNAAIESYYWDFGDGDTSSQATPTHTYADTGTYVLKLVVNRNNACTDSATALVLVYPGFVPGFATAGNCIGKPVSFTDTSKSVYGVVNKWNWDFGVQSLINDTSVLKNPTYTYQQLGPKTIRLIVGDSKGCRDTAYRTVNILDKPDLDVAFSDTLICRGDTVRLRAIGVGNFSWSPSVGLSNPNVADPLVNPVVTTTYEVKLDQNGCINFDTVQVRVVNFVSLQAMPDTVICLTDSLRLGAITNGLQFSWSPGGSMNDPTLLRPTVKPAGTTLYQLTSTIGNCSTTDDVLVTTVPYPSVNAGADTVVCFGISTQLQASIDASTFIWSPVNTLANAHTLSPIASPRNTTMYTLTVTDDKGCPKAVRDTVIVTVLPRMRAYAGNDTSVVVGQPVQLKAVGGVGYQWSPSTSLSDPDIGDPVGIYDGSFDSIRYKILVFNEEGCVDSAFKTIRIFRTDPRIFVPNAFTPNGDGLNDVIKPIAAGIERIEYFHVFNRWGQMVFSTTTNGQGWDGKINGKVQGTEVFVWVVKATDYKGAVFFAKGTVTLIR